MGRFTEKFKFMTRHSRADFSREQTVDHWKRELVELMIRSGNFKFKNEPDEEEDKNVSTHTD